MSGMLAAVKGQVSVFIRFSRGAPLLSICHLFLPANMVYSSAVGLSSLPACHCDRILGHFALQSGFCCMGLSKVELSSSMLHSLLLRSLQPPSVIALWTSCLLTSETYHLIVTCQATVATCYCACASVLINALLFLLLSHLYG